MGFSDNSSHADEVSMPIESAIDTHRSEFPSQPRFVDGLIVNRDGKYANRIAIVLMSIMSRLGGSSVWIMDKAEGTRGTQQLCQQMNSRDRELEEYRKFAYWALVLTYAILYAMLSAHLGRNDNHATVMKGVHIWSIIMMMSMFGTSFVRRHRTTIKIVHISTAGLLFISSLFVFCLLQLTL